MLCCVKRHTRCLNSRRHPFPAVEGNSNTSGGDASFPERKAPTLWTGLAFITQCNQNKVFRLFFATDISVWPRGTLVQKGSDNENGIYFPRRDNRDFLKGNLSMYLCICLSVLWVCLNLRYRKPQLCELSRWTRVYALAGFYNTNFSPGCPFLFFRL